MATVARAPSQAEIDQAELARRELARRHLADFLRFRFAAERREMLWNWHLDYLCELLEAVTRRELKRLIINIPPRFLKSELVSQTWQAWMIGRDNGPRSSMVSACFSSSLASRDSRKTREVIESAWYQRVFPGVELNKSTEAEWATTMGAERTSAGAMGTITGKGGDHLVGDDLLKPTDANSELVREKTNEWLGETFRSRLNDQKNGTITIIAQRLHERDPCGYLLEKMKVPGSDQYKHVSLPLECEQRTLYSFGEFLYIRKRGELLHEARIGPAEVDALKAAGGVNYEGQYQQRPVKQTGGMLKPDKLVEIDHDAPTIIKMYGLRPNFYLDLATREKEREKDDPDSSVVSVMARDSVAFGRVHILDQWGEQCDPEEFARKLIEMHRIYRPGRVKGGKNGVQNQFRVILRQACRIMHYPYFHIEDMPDDKDKVFKAGPLEGLLNLNSLCVPARAPWLSLMKAEWRTFPRGRHDDRVDSPAHGAADLQSMRAGEIPPSSEGMSPALEKQLEQIEYKKRLERARMIARGDKDVLDLFER